jgi:glycine cleavage system H protein
MGSSVTEPTSHIPDDRRYTEEHEWALAESDGTVLIGITDFAQHELGDVVYADLPKPGTQVTATNEFGAVESVKAASDLFSPITGEVVAVNEALVEQPELINDSPYDQGWMIRVRAADPKELDQLLDADAYRALLRAEA